MPEPKLVAAYRAARYRIRIDERHWIERRIGVVDATADAALAAVGCRARWSIVTPCNPGSRLLPAEDNERRVAALCTQLQDAGWRYLLSENRAADGSWPEAGFCVLDVTRGQMRMLATGHDQHAFVDAQLGRAPELVWLTTV
jgi:hypothetical protein